MTTTTVEIQTPDKSGLPDVAFTGGGKVAAVQPVTLDNVQYVIDSTRLEPRMNMSTAQVVFFHAGRQMGLDQATQGYAEIAFLDVCLRVGMKARDQVREALGTIALFKPYHPMEDWLRSLEWDGEDRLDALAASITTTNTLWPIYLENWLVQVVDGVCSWRNKEKASLPHVLVLVGGQGVGKSYWLNQLGGEWFKGEAELHLSSTSGKDHQLEALKYPMVELAELDGIFRKADVSHMKSFISRDVDSIRAPYERRALVRPRMTSFCGSVNDAEFLNDPTGSRRFWPVQVSAIDWAARVDFEQLWAQVFSFWGENTDFNLTAEEDALRAAVAVDRHSIESDEAEMVREYLRLHLRNPSFTEVAMSTLDVLQMLYGKQRTFSNKQKSDAGRILRDILGEHHTIAGKQRSWMVPRNDFATDKALWPDNISLK